MDISLVRNYILLFYRMKGLLNGFKHFLTDHGWQFLYVTGLFQKIFLPPPPPPSPMDDTELGTFKFQDFREGQE